MDLLRGDANAEILSAALGGQYELIRLLGRGGMGTVYLARESFLDREVAVKVLPADVTSGDARERFLREARTAAKLSHPNIVPLYTFGQAGELLYYIMGYVEGESLETRLRRDGRLDFDDARHIARELADALDYAHQLGVVHRDLKPDNVLLDRRTGRAMLTDFGIARQLATHETLTQTGVVVGTPHYMSPEQASGEREIDGRSDVYSLGVILYRMVTGRLPFEGSDLRQVLAQHATRLPPPPSQMVTGLPLDIDTTVTRALAKSRTERWPNARTMRDALSPDSDEALPDDLRDIACVGANGGWLSVALLEIAYLGWIYGFGPRPWVLVGLAIALHPVMGIALIRPVRRFGWRPTLGAWFRQPVWWKSWWPRFSRRPGDVWDRLPRPVRSVRTLSVVVGAASVLFANVSLFILRPDWLGAHPAFLAAHHVIWPTVLFLAALVGALTQGTLAFRGWATTNGVSRTDARRFASEATFGSAFWSRPHVATLLSPAGPAPELTSAPRDVANELRVLARDAASSPHASLLAEAADAADAIAAAVAAADAELTQLARDADPEEHTRIKTSLARTQEPQMRELLERQMQLVSELGRRQQEVRARRERLVAQLRTLSLHVAALRAQSAMDTAAAAEITGRIHAICRGIERQVEAVTEVRRALSS
jgi:serine/threonine-protein kinase